MKPTKTSPITSTNRPQGSEEKKTPQELRINKITNIKHKQKPKKSLLSKVVKFLAGSHKKGELPEGVTLIKANRLSNYVPAAGKVLSQNQLNELLDAARLPKVSASSPLANDPNLTKEYGAWEMHIGAIASLIVERGIKAAVNDGTYPFMTQDSAGHFVAEKSRTKDLVKEVEQKSDIHFEQTSPLANQVNTQIFGLIASGSAQSLKSVTQHKEELYEKALSELEAMVDKQLDLEGNDSVARAKTTRELVSRIFAEVLSAQSSDDSYV